MKPSLDIHDPDTATRVSFLVFPLYTWGKMEGKPNRKAPFSMTVLGEQQENGMPPLAHAIHRLKFLTRYTQEVDGKDIVKHLSFQVLKIEDAIDEVAA